MNIKQLEIIKGVYDALNAGISNPITINTAYSYLPNNVDGTPIRAKINAINRFMMLNFADYLKAANEVLEVQPIVESIGTIENKPKQTHSEEPTGDSQDIKAFLTAEQKESLSQPLAGTTLEIQSSDGKKKRTRSPNGQHKPRGTKITKAD